MSGITCTMRPSAGTLSMLAKLGRVDPRKAIEINAALDDLAMVDAYAALLDEAMAAATNASGKLDLKDMAAFLIRRQRDSAR